MHTFIQDTEQKGHQPFLLKKNKEFHRSSQKTGGTTNRDGARPACLSCNSRTECNWPTIVACMHNLKLLLQYDVTRRAATTFMAPRD